MVTKSTPAAKRKKAAPKKKIAPKKAIKKPVKKKAVRKKKTANPGIEKIRALEDRVASLISDLEILSMNCSLRAARMEAMWERVAEAADLLPPEWKSWFDANGRVPYEDFKDEPVEVSLEKVEAIRAQIYDYCLKCGGELKKKWFGMGRIIGCKNPRCDKFYK